MTLTLCPNSIHQTLLRFCLSYCCYLCCVLRSSLIPLPSFIRAQITSGMFCTTFTCSSDKDGTAPCPYYIPFKTHLTMYNYTHLQRDGNSVNKLQCMKSDLWRDIVHRVVCNSHVLLSMWNIIQRFSFEVIQLHITKTIKEKYMTLCMYLAGASGILKQKISLEQQKLIVLLFVCLLYILCLSDVEL